MIQLPETVNSWDTPSFKTIFKDEVEQLDARLLPLQAGLLQGSYVSDSNFKVMVLGVGEEAGVIHANAGIFYTSVIAGCNCADDPTTIDEQTEYCEVRFAINKNTAEARVSLVD